MADRIPPEPLVLDYASKKPRRHGIAKSISFLMLALGIFAVMLSILAPSVTQELNVVLNSGEECRALRDFAAGKVPVLPDLSLALIADRG